MGFLLKIEGDFEIFYVDFFCKIEGEFNFLVNFFLGPIHFKGISYVKFKAIFFWFQKFFKGISYIKFIPLLVLHVLRLGDFNFWRNWRKVKFKGISLKRGSYSCEVSEWTEVIHFWSFNLFQFKICWRGCYG